MKNTYLSVICWIIPFIVFSQNPDQSKMILKALSVSQLEDYNREAERITEAFGKYISYMANANLTIETRLDAARNAKGLFINKEVTIQDTVFCSKPLTVESYIKHLLENNQSDIKIEWNDIFPFQEFNLDTAIKKIEIEQVVRYYENYPKPKIEKSSKIIENHFKLEYKFIYNETTELIEIKLGNIVFKT